ncbi:MAG TPA: phospholipase D-like domain-containing protein [Planktothrix sp.]|jgi:DNA-binding XRE family transcriptional regulator
MVIFNAEVPGCSFDESTYETQMAADFVDASARIIIVSPYLTAKAIERWDSLIRRAVSRGVRICIYVQEPRNWKRRLEPNLPERTVASMEKLASAMKYIQSLGVHVTLRPGDHEKFVIVDEHIFWSGSLNLLSWFDTREWLRRVESRMEVSAMIDKYNLLPCGYCPTKQTIGAVVRARRETFNLTQEEVANLAAVSIRTIFKIEIGESVQLNLIEKVCGVLDLSLHVSATYTEHGCVQQNSELTVTRFDAMPSKGFKD